jgi:hypothetical protein
VLSLTQQERGKKGDHLPSISVKGLALTMDEDDVVRHLRRSNITGFVSVSLKFKAAAETHSQNSEDVAVTLRSMLTSSAAGFGELEDLQVWPPSEGKLRGKAFATLSTPGAAAKVLDELCGADAAKYHLGHGRLQVRPNLSTTITLERSMGEALYKDLSDTIRQISESAQGACKITLNDKGQKGWSITINSEWPEPVAAARLALEPILSGTRYSCGEHAETIKVLFTPHGRKAMEEIQASVAGGYIHYDRRQGAILLYGNPGIREQLWKRLTQHVETTNNDAHEVLKLPRGGVRAVVGTDGRKLDRLANRSGCTSIELSIQKQTITMRGPQEAVQLARQTLQTDIDAAAPPKSTDDDGDTEEVCGVCFCEVEPEEKKIQLQGCGHVCHQECILMQLTSAAQPGGKLPVQCVTCEVPFIVRDLAAIANPRTLADLHQTSYRAYVNEQNADLLPCPTADCPQVVRKDHPGAWQCDCCLQRYCIRCMMQFQEEREAGPPEPVQAHVDMSCEDYILSVKAAQSGAVAEDSFQAFLKQGLTDDSDGLNRIRKCPNCQTPQSKDGACNKVTCHSCRRHFCFACARFHAATGDEVYTHMGRCPGYRG